MKNDYLQRLKYIFWDIIAAGLSYTALYTFRRIVIEKERFEGSELTFSDNYYLGLVLIAFFWITVYWITGFYRDIYRRSRLKELIYTFNASLLGSIFIFFALILDDWVSNYTDYYRGFLVYFSSQFIITALFRFLISTRTSIRIKKGKIWFNTILIGSNDNAVELYTDMAPGKSNGNRFVGFVSVHNNIRFLVEKNLEHLGTHTELPQIIERERIEEVIIAIESSEHEKLEEIINILEDTNVTIKMIPDTYDIISGKVRLGSLGAPLIEIRHELMPLWQKVVKRFMDIMVSAVVLIILSPLFLFTAIMVRMSSPGPIFFRQSRMGHGGRSFDMIKFRSMVQDAEKDGPQLSSENDERITNWGRFMRKYRLDELPQFVNVILGQMSIVGPRPERQYYIEQIMRKAPHYKHVLKVKPGITSWGMVKFGYAENVEEMVQRLKYDVIYIENMNLFNDLKVLIYTILIVLQGRGK
ncbi:MAG: polyprenyl glycosylphosphotransferase [Owenweeksia sp.]|nr:polyprenyl glycosylphosphotransferase [Owenweeksia sp.]